MVGFHGRTSGMLATGGVRLAEDERRRLDHALLDSPARGGSGNGPARESQGRTGAYLVLKR